jgi:hypothetical protein
VLLDSEIVAKTLHPCIQDANKLNEVPRAQSLLDRPTLADLFKRDKGSIKSKRDDKIGEALLRHGYRLAEIGWFLDLH